MTAAQGALSAAERSMRSVFVGNIPYEATEEQLKDIFSEVGPVVSFRLVYDRETGKPKGYGFCEYKDQEMALSAMRNLNGFELNGRALRVDNAASEKSKEELKNLQASLGGPPVESPYGPEVSPEKAPELISKVMCSVPPEQLNELMMQMKSCLESNPNEARNLLLQNPQLSFALLQALVIMKVVDTEKAKSMLHDPGYQPTPPGALLPTPEKNNPATTAETAPVAKNEVGNFPAAMSNIAVQSSNARPSQSVQPLSRPVLLGERPNPMQERQGHGNAGQMLPNPFQERGDHDLRQMPMTDRDMRAPPMMGGDKDMRHPPVVDQDLRTMGGMPEGRSFDPRFRNMQGDSPMMGGGHDGRAMAPPGPMQGPHGRQMQPGAGPGFDRPRVGAGPYDGPGGRMDDPRTGGGPQGGMAGGRGPQNPRVSAVGGASPALGGASPNPGASPRLSNPLAAAAAAIAPNDHEKANLIMQVLQLSDQQISMLPPEQRHSIMVLKEQIARTQQI